MASPDGSSSSSTMPENLKLRQRWGHGIDIRSADEADITQYTEWRISVYGGMVWKRAEDLVDYYADDFKDFTRDAFSACPLDVQKRLRDCLRERGIYVRKGHGIQVANELHKAVHEDSPWPESPDDDDDPDEPEIILRETIPAPPSAVRTTIPAPAAIRTTIPAPPSVATITTFLSLCLELSKRLHAEGKITEGPPFFLSRRKEIDGLKAKGVFEIATKENDSVERRATEMECLDWG